MKQLTATDFKTHCLSLLDEVEQCGTVIHITKRGKFVAELRPIPQSSKKKYPQFELLGSVSLSGKTTALDFIVPVIGEDEINFEADTIR